MPQPLFSFVPFFSIVRYRGNLASIFLRNEPTLESPGYYTGVQDVYNIWPASVASLRDRGGAVPV